MPYFDLKSTYYEYRFHKKAKNYKKAYECLVAMVDYMPDNLDILNELIYFCIKDWHRPDFAKPWMKRLLKKRSWLSDYLNLATLEVQTGNIHDAKALINKAKKLQKQDPDKILQSKCIEPIEIIEKMIKAKEDELSSSFHDEVGASLKGTKKGTSIKTDSKGSTVVPKYHLEVRTDILDEAQIEAAIHNNMSFNLKEAQMQIEYAYFTLQGGYDELICLNMLNGVEKYWYQTETVKKVLKRFRGRVLLCDEVGLGKTIEAGIAIKEYLMRGMVRNILILTPAPLVSQWKEEMATKFGIDFISTDDRLFSEDIEKFWKQRFIIASISTAKSKKYNTKVTREFYDLVVVDEAHHLRNRTTLAWKLVNQLKKKFIFLLTATPVQNNLIELFNLITLLKPGQFKTEKQFKQEYVKKGNLKASADKDKLRELLSEVMIRNTRSAIDIKLTNRYAVTMKLVPSDMEINIYSDILNFLRKNNFNKMTTNLLLREAGSSPFALAKTIIGLINRNEGYLVELKPILDLIHVLGDFSKGKAVLDIIQKKPSEKKVIFTQYIKSMEYLMDILKRHNIPFTTFRGDMTLKEKDDSIKRFREDINILLSSESGGEGRNLQFCNTIINFDLPWNPMKIEQRIGRVHRIGQKKDVFVFNLSVKGTIEDHIIDILDNKINMFEMVIGEIEPILGHLSEEKEFEAIILDIWYNSADDESMNEGFIKLGNDLINAKKKYLKTKSLDDDIFGEDYEI